MSVRFRCRLGWHAWSRWETTAEGRVLTFCSSETIGFWARQERGCLHCGALGLRVVQRARTQWFSTVLGSDEGAAKRERERDALVRKLLEE